MKTLKSYLKYFKKIEKNIACSLKIPSENFVKEDYHQLRVEIKKLNALLISLELCLKSLKRNKYFEPLTAAVGVRANSLESPKKK